MSAAASDSIPNEFTSYAPEAQSNMRWFVCFLLFLATTINYMDRNVFGYVEPLLHNAAFMGWDHAADKFHQKVFDNNFGNVIIWFQIAYGCGFLIAGRIIDKLGTKVGYAIAIGIWGLSSLSHSVVTSVFGFSSRASSSAWARAATSPPPSRPSASGSPPKSAPRPSASSTPAPTPAR
jgi:ACS family hexuronate transporter-like MFS transporter